MDYPRGTYFFNSKLVYSLSFDFSLSNITRGIITPPIVFPIMLIRT